MVNRVIGCEDMSPYSKVLCSGNDFNRPVGSSDRGVEDTGFPSIRISGDRVPWVKQCPKFT